MAEPEKTVERDEDSSSQGQGTYSTSQKADMWKLFSKTAGDCAKCKVCEKLFKVKHSNTSTLRRHASTYHKAEFDKATAQKVKQTTIQACLSKHPYAQGSAQLQRGHKVLMEMIAQDMMPLSVVEGQGFKNFVKYLDPRYTPPSRATLRNKLLPGLFSKIQEELKVELAEASFVALTTDMWTSRTMAAFTSVTAHYWCEKLGCLLTRILDCARFFGSHTAAAISTELGRILFEVYSLPREKITNTTSDIAANVQKALEDSNLPHEKCFAHQINLVVTKSLDSTKGFPEVKEKVARIVKYIRHSPKGKENFQAAQKTVGFASTKELILDVATRWNSTFSMLERAFELKTAINLFVSQYPMPDDVQPLNSYDWACVESIMGILKPFYELTVELSSEKHASLSKVVPVCKLLFKFYSTKVAKTSATTVEQELCQHILGQLKHRFQSVEFNHILSLATLLDPRFKQHAFTNPERVAKTMQYLKEEIVSSLTVQGHDVHQHPVEQATEKQDSIWSNWDKLVSKSNPKENVSAMADIEIRRYLNLQCLDRQIDVLKWWNSDGKAAFPSLERIAKKYLSIPATSVPSERLFSTAGDIISAKRNRLDDESARMLIFLHANFTK